VSKGRTIVAMALATFNNYFPKHLFPMDTTFKRCFLCNFSIDPKVLKSVLPGPIYPHLFQNEAFLSVVIADMDKMKVAFLPNIFGINYSQVVYRAVVKVKDHENGVHFLRSDADNRFMCYAGNAGSFFHFNYGQIKYDFYNTNEASWRTARPVDSYSNSTVFDHNKVHPTKIGQIKLEESEIARIQKIAENDNSDKFIIKPRFQNIIPDPSKQLLKISVLPEKNDPPAKIIAEMDLTTASKEMPKSSIFPTLQIAKAFFTDLFTAYSVHPITKKLTKVKINRSEWNIEVIHDHAGIYELMSNSLPFPASSTHLDSVFHVQDLYYYWYTLEQHNT